MKIKPGMLPPGVVREVNDGIDAHIEPDRKDLMLLKNSFQYFSMADRIATILKRGVADREKINQDMRSGKIAKGKCYRRCYHCCRMSLTYEVEAFDILLSYRLNRETIDSAYVSGKFDSDKKWCGMLTDGLCNIHHFKPYVCLLTLPSPRGAEKGGCYFKGERNAKTAVHKQTMIVTGKMRRLFKEWLPDVPAFAGTNINQAFIWSLKIMKR